MITFKYLFYFCVISFALGACGSSGGGGDASTPTEPVALAFYESDGLCFNAKNNERADASRCEDLKFTIEDGKCTRVSDEKVVSINNCTTSRFIMGQNTCYNRSGNAVDNKNCNATTTPISSRSRICTGPHIQFIKDDILEGVCDGIAKTGNCSGAILFDLEAQEYVDCQ